jgi:hypothetical protein
VIVEKFTRGFFAPAGSMIIGVAACAGLAAVAWLSRQCFDRRFMLLVATAQSDT